MLCPRSPRYWFRHLLAIVQNNSKWPDTPFTHDPSRCRHHRQFPLIPIRNSILRSRPLAARPARSAPTLTDLTPYLFLAFLPGICFIFIILGVFFLDVHFRWFLFVPSQIGVERFLYVQKVARGLSPSFVTCSRSQYFATIIVGLYLDATGTPTVRRWRRKWLRWPGSFFFFFSLFF